MRLPRIKSEKLVKSLHKKFNAVIRGQRGSHVKLSFNCHGERRIQVIPLHKGREISTGIIQRIVQFLSECFGRERSEIIELLLDP